MIELPSAVQRGDSWSLSSCVTRSGAPPDSMRIQICRRPSTGATNATMRPSGDSAGDSLTPTRSVRRWNETDFVAAAPADAGRGRIGSSRSAHTSPMSRSRRRRSRSGIGAAPAGSARGRPAGSADQSGSCVSVAAMTSDSVSPSNGVAAGEHREQHAAERPDVGALVHLLTARLLRDSCSRACRG